eukprot:1892028-Pyramimonas_sp.AAC.1
MSLAVVSVSIRIAVWTYQSHSSHAWHSAVIASTRKVQPVHSMPRNILGQENGSEASLLFESAREMSKWQNFYTSCARSAWRSILSCMRLKFSDAGRVLRPR